MSVYITIGDIAAFYGAEAPTQVIQSIIDVVDGANACLDGAGISDAQQKLLKIYAVCHQLTMQSGGQVKSASSMTGDSISYNAASGAGIGASNWGVMMKSMPGSDCVEAIFNKSDIQVFSVGRRC